MQLQFTLDSQLQFTHWHDALGNWPVTSLTTPVHSQQTPYPGLRLLRYDDAWRPLYDGSAPLAHTAASPSEHRYTGLDQAGGRHAYARPDHVGFPHFWPAAFDYWPYAGDLRHHQPHTFRTDITTRQVSNAFATGIEFTITLHDQRDPQKNWPTPVLALAVGIQLPLPDQGACFGTYEMFEHAHLMQHDLADPALPQAWHYLESDLFGLNTPRLDDPYTPDPARGQTRIHTGSPLLAFRDQDPASPWVCVASEADYGSTTLWAKHHVRHCTVLYLKPAGTAHWKFCIWRQQTNNPNQLLLACTTPNGFFNDMNPLGFTPHGAHAGMTAFVNVNHVDAHWPQLQAARPQWVYLNYYYEHICSVANSYGSWINYEGFHYNEAKVRSIIARFRKLGCHVGYYGTQIEQPDTHQALREDDIILDKFGRRLHAWEPGNWVIDAGNDDCAQRLAKAEAEFGQYYQLEGVFVDRLDHLGVNHNPARRGRGRLQLVPSIRMGCIELNKQRMIWQRKLNPHAYVCLNNTTAWAGVRYSDFCLLEGGDACDDPSLALLYQPSGIIHLKHFGIMFHETSQVALHQAIGINKTQSDSQVISSLRRMIRNSLLTFSEGQPYGDEHFVDPQSMFYAPGKNKRDPDDQKLAYLASLPYTGGQAWREMYDQVAPALDAAYRLTRPVQAVWTQPDHTHLPLPAKVKFHARQGTTGLVVALQNHTNAPLPFDLQVAGHRFTDTCPPDATYAAWRGQEPTDHGHVIF